MPQHNAFISYSHTADRELAVSLERGLKRFTKPWYQRQALRVFRDETDLSAAPALWSLIQQALDGSEFLIVLADPASAKSPWVDREIEHWLRTKGPESILIVLTGGSLQWDGRGAFDPSLSESIPPRLLTAFAEEPLYVDMRWARNASNLSLRDPRFLNQIADLAAPLHRKPKAELASAEVREHRRTVRVAWSAGIGLSVLLVAAVVLAFPAETQRRVANAKQHEAEITLARSDFAQGIQQVGADAVGIALPRLGRSLLLEPGRQSTAVRLVSLLTQRWLPRVATAGPSLSGPIKYLQYSKSGRILAAASADELQVWDVAAGKSLLSGTKHENFEITGVEFSPDDKWLAMSESFGGGGAHGEVRVWDLSAPAAAPKQIAVNGLLWSAKFTPGGKTLATASAFAIEFWRLDGTALPGKVDLQQFAQQIPDFSRVDNSYTDFVFVAAGDEIIIVAGMLGSGFVARYSLKEVQLKAIKPLPLMPGPVAIDASSSLVLLRFPNRVMNMFRRTSAQKRGTAIVLDRESLDPKSRAMGHEDLIGDIRFLPHGQLIFSGGEDGTLKLWDAGDGSPVAFSGRHRDRVTSIDVATHGLLLASAAMDGTAR
jgi:MTH538 TIR-like domain (DUF1863)/WD domain, G-beta repeat